MKVGHTHALTTVYLVLASLALVACGGGDRPAVVGPDHPRALTFLGVMQYLPVIEGEFDLFYSDYAFARETFGIALPPVGASVAEVGRYRNAMFVEAQVVGPGYFGGFNGRLESEAWTIEVGFNVLDVDQEAVSSFPTNDPDFSDSPLSVVRGRIDPARVEAAVRTDPIFSGLLREERLHGVTYYAWPDKLDRSLSRFGVHRAYGGRLAADDGHALWTYVDEGMEAMLDASRGQRDSLADVEAIRKIALAIEALNAHYLLISSDENSMDEENIRDLVTDIYGKGNVQRLEEEEGLLEPYEAIALGTGYDGAEHTAVLIYVYRTEEQAVANASLLREKLATGISLAFRRPWSEQITASSVDVSGTTILVSITDAPLIGLNAFYNLDGLILTKAKPIDPADLTCIPRRPSCEKP